MDEYKQKQLDNAPYQIGAYDEYCYMLAVAFDLYQKQNDPAGMKFCRDRLLAVPERLAALEQKTDPLALQIDDKPSFDLSEDSLSYIEQIRAIEPG